MRAGDPRWSRVNELFHAAVAVSPADRDAFLSTQCGADAALRAEIESLLAMHRDGDERAIVPLRSGSRFGDYEITGFIASGAMGDVYRARDTRLRRDAALKVLPTAVISDPDRRARFEREARTLASLTHPHIATIYGVEEADGLSALALELVDGETLADRIARGGLPVDEALRIARQIAQALETAHEHGIVHRDLKPANVKITRDGVVKVLDFGLAKLAESRGDATLAPASAVATLPHLTNVGVIVGTPAYMSPEQARGERADQRSDIWAFGCVLYEMLTGQPAFSANTVADTLARVLASEPKMEALPKGVPENVRTLITRCLTKDRVQRIPHASVLRYLLDESNTPTRDESWRTWTLNLLQNRASRAVVIVAVVMFAGVLQVAVRELRSPLSPPPRVSRLVIAPSAEAMLSINGNVRDIAITPDGSRIVYTGNNGTELFVRALDALEPISLYKGTPRGPFVSPDGQWIGFFDDFTTLKRVAIAGGPAMTLTTIDGGASRGAVWTRDDVIVFASNSTDSGLQKISAGGGMPTVLTNPDHNRGEFDHLWPELLPDGRNILFTVVPTAPSPRSDAAQIASLDLQTGKRKILVARGSHAHYVSSGHLVYASAGTLRAVAFDAATMSTRSDSVPIIPDVLMTNPGGMDAVIAQDGTLAYVPGGIAPLQRRLVWVDRDNKETVIPAPVLNYTYPRLSPDGTIIAFWRPGQGNIWQWDLTRSAMSRVTLDSVFQDSFPIWTPDGRRIIFSSRRTDSQSANIFWQAADGTGSAQRLTETAHQQSPTAITPDGTRLVFTEAGDKTGDDVMELQLNGTHSVRPLVRTSFAERNGVVSPDGRWLAYEAEDSGQSEVYVRPYPNVGGGRWQISAGGGDRPLWSRDGHELFYVGRAAFMRAAVQGGASWVSTTPSPVVPLSPPAGGAQGSYTVIGPNIPGRTYDISSDGQRLLIVKNVPAAANQETSPHQIVVVQHFDQELKRLVPGK
jgi:eukaryotic-like serine/threonine-protein kinase